MKSLIRGEWKKLICNKVFRVMVLIMVLLSTAYAFMQYRVTLANKELIFFSSGDVGLGSHIFWFVMKDPSVASCFSIVFAALLLGTDFKNRGIQTAIMAGYSRGKIFAVKVVQYYVLTMLVLAIYPVLSVIVCCIPWFQTLDAAGIAYVVQSFALKFLLDLEIVSVGLVFVFLCRDILKTICVSLVYTLSISWLSNSASKNVDSVWDRLWYYVPLSHYGSIVMKPEVPGIKQNYWPTTPPTTEQILIIVLGSLIFVSLSILIAYLIFRKAELK